MVVYTKHPIAAPPGPLVRDTTRQLWVRAWCIFVVAAALGGPAWLMAFGMIGAVVVAVGSALVSIVLWAVLRPSVQWPRLPWYAVGFVLWAVASLIWSHWREASAATLLLLVITTMQALFIGAVLTWREIVRVVASALKWILSLSLAFELWVSLIWGGTILPQFTRPDGPVDDPIVLWSRDNLFDGGRIQGIFGDANSLAWVSLLAVIVFGIRIADRAPRRGYLVVWVALAVFLMVRAGSVTAFLAAGFVALVLGTALLMRTVDRPGGRTRYYTMYVALAAVGGVAALIWYDDALALMGRTTDLTGRLAIWEAVGERIVEHPVIGWGFSTPWIPSEPLVDGWIVDHGVTVVQAHGMWIDVLYQLGIIGTVLLAMTYLAYIWRAWFFAVDRPRWDLVADRPYTAVTLLPTLTGALLIVQSAAESAPLLNWGWLLLVVFGFKIKQAPLVGRGPSEARLAGEQGEPIRPRS